MGKLPFQLQYQLLDPPAPLIYPVCPALAKLKWIFLPTNKTQEFRLSNVGQGPQDGNDPIKHGQLRRHRGNLPVIKQVEQGGLIDVILVVHKGYLVATQSVRCQKQGLASVPGAVKAAWSSILFMDIKLNIL